MRFIFLILSISVIVSCDVGDDSNLNQSNNLHFEILPVKNISIPDAFVLGETYDISMAYVLPTNCHFFNDIYYHTEGNARIVAVVSEVTNSSSCSQSNNETIVSFNFVPRLTGVIIFKFWQGLDENQNDLYIEIPIPVIE